MVLVEEVPEDILLQENEHESDFETDSEASSVSPLDEKYALEELDDDDEFTLADETLYDRFVALKDMIPPQTRLAIESSLESTRSWSAWGFNSTLKVGWWFSTSALLVAMPLLLAVEDEAKIMSQEREMQMQAQGQQQSWGRVIIRKIMVDKMSLADISQMLGTSPGPQGVLPPGF